MQAIEKRNLKSMTAGAMAVVLLSALLHASWNALLRSSENRLRSILIMNVTSGAIAFPLAFLLPAVPTSVWPILGLSLALQVSYCFSLDLAYRQGEMSQIYPVMRGVAPMLVTAGAAISVGEKLAPMTLVGICIVSTGILTLSMERKPPNLRSTAAAISAGVLIAAFTVVDGIGARRSLQAASYALWLFSLQALAMPIAYMITRGTPSIKLYDIETAKGAVAGILALLAYGSIIVALTLSPMGQVSALRELSIVFATLIGAIFLKESVSILRIVAALIITAGAVTLSLSH